MCFSDHQWAESEKLRRYLMESDDKQEEQFKRTFESTVRGGFYLDLEQVAGWLGPVDGQRIGQANSAIDWLFKRESTHNTRSGNEIGLTR